MMTDPLPPFSNEDEAAALGCVLDCDNPTELFDQLAPDYFYDLRHRTIFGAMQAVATDLGIDLVGVGTYLREQKLIGTAGGLEYLSGLPDRKHSVANFPSWLHTLKDLASRRAALRDAAELTLLARDKTVPRDTLRGAAERMARTYSISIQEEAPILARPIGDFELPPDNDPTELLKYRFLCERGSLLITGPTGVGKSSFNMQALALWANNLPFFGITPAKPLTSILIQAENDDGDIAEMRNGICTGLKFTEAQRKEFFEKVLVFSSNGVTGRKFCEEVLRPLLDLYPQNLVVIDPALSFMGGDVKEQKDVGSFLRQHLNPQLYAHNSSCLMIHHTNKPKAGNEDTAPLNGDWAYQGSGSAEWANWARGVISLQSSGSPGVYKLHAGKRAARIGWRDSQDQIIFEKIIIHSREKGVICWKEGEKSDLPDRGRPKSYKQADVIDLLGDYGLTTSEWQQKCGAELGISRATFHRLKTDLSAADLVLKSKANDKWVKISKS
jgi:hypothetical protein